MKHFAFVGAIVALAAVAVFRLGWASKSEGAQSRPTIGKSEGDPAAHDATSAVRNIDNGSSVGASASPERDAEKGVVHGAAYSGGAENVGTTTEIDVAHATPLEILSVSKLALPLGVGAKSPAVLKYAISVSNDYSGNAYIADSGNSRIVKLAPDGKVLAVFGDDERYGPRLNQPLGIATVTVDNEPVTAVADTRNNRVVIYDANGRFVRIVNAADHAGVGLNDPEGVALDGLSRRILVADTMNHRVVVYNWEGAVESTIGDVKTLQYPKGVAVDSAGRIYISNFNRNQISVFDPAGIHVTDFAGTPDNPMTFPTGLCVDTRDRLWVAEMGGHQVRVLDRTGTTLASIGPANKSAPIDLDHPKGVSVFENSIWVTSPGLQVVKKIGFSKP